VELLGDERVHNAVEALAEEFRQRGRALHVLAQALAVNRAVADSLEDGQPHFAGAARKHGLHLLGAEGRNKELVGHGASKEATDQRTTKAGRRRGCWVAAGAVASEVRCAARFRGARKLHKVKFESWRLWMRAVPTRKKT
jgi:hypothetical protein